MKNFVLLALAANLVFAALDSSHADEAKLGAPAQTAYQQLQRAETFALGGVGRGGQTSAQELAFRQLAQDANAQSAFTALINDEKTTKVGQLYGLLGLKEQFPAQFEEQLPHFLTDDAPVQWINGCLFATVATSEIARYIKDIPATQKESNS